MSISRTGKLYITSAGRHASDTSDLKLIRSIAAGDKQAMQILFARHNVRVFRFLARFVGDKSAAEDLVSEVFLGRLAPGRTIPGSIPGYHLASRDCPQ